MEELKHKRQGKLEKLGLIPEIIQMRYNRYSYQKIVDTLKEKYNLAVTIPTVINSISSLPNHLENKNEEKNNKDEIIESILNDNEENTTSESETAQDILYDNRSDIVRYRKEEHWTNAQIAKEFNVKESDVASFFSKRTYLTDDQKKEIILRYKSGTSITSLSLDYNVNKKTIESLIKRELPKTQSTSPLVSAKQELITIQTSKQYENPLIKNPTIVKDFINFTKWIELSYYNAEDEIKKFDSKRNDIFHEIELKDLDDIEKVKKVNEIQKISINRREYKDFCEIVKPLVEYMDQNNGDNKKKIEELANVAGRINNTAKAKNNRIYFFRSNDDGESENKNN